MSFISFISNHCDSEVDNFSKKNRLLQSIKIWYVYVTDSLHDVYYFTGLPNTKIFQQIADSITEVSFKFVICRRLPTCSQLMQGYSHMVLTELKWYVLNKWHVLNLISKIFWLYYLVWKNENTWNCIT